MQFIANFSVLRMQEMLFQRSKFKKFPGGGIPLANSIVSVVLGSHLRRLDILGEGQGENVPFGSFAPPLKNP
jgi:hypothetical protein